MAGRYDSTTRALCTRGPLSVDSEPSAPDQNFDLTLMKYRILLQGGTAVYTSISNYEDSSQIRGQNDLNKIKFD